MAGENLLVVDDSPTILKVVETVLTRAGFRVDTALDVASGMALARSRRPAVILVDSLIPGDPGLPPPSRPAGAAQAPATDDVGPGPRGSVDLCGALAADAHLARTPIVLMTAKGEDLEARYARRPNVIDYISKPFSPDAVLAVVTHVIEKMAAVTESAARASPLSAAGAVTEALSRSAGPGQASALDRLRHMLCERLERTRQESDAWEIEAIAHEGLPDDVLADLLADAGFEAVAEDGGPDLAGRLAADSMSEVLSLIAQQTQTGALRVLTDGARVDLFFRRGRIDFAAAVGVAEEFLLGRFAVESGHLTPEALGAVLDQRARMSGKPPLFGHDLVERGLLSPDELKTAMRRQTAELTYETLRWSRGKFQFTHADELPELAKEASLGMAVDVVLLEGFRRVDEWRVIEQDIQSFDQVFVRDDIRVAALPRGTLTRDEIAVLDALTGRSSVRDVVRSLKLGSFDVTKILYRLLRAKLIRHRVEPIPVR